MNRGVIAVPPEDTNPIKKNAGNVVQPTGLLTPIKSKIANTYLFMTNI